MGGPLWRACGAFKLSLNRTVRVPNYDRERISVSWKTIKIRKRVRSNVLARLSFAFDSRKITTFDTDTRAFSIQARLFQFLILTAYRIRLFSSDRRNAYIRPPYYRRFVRTPIIARRFAERPSVSRIGRDISRRNRETLTVLFPFPRSGPRRRQTGPNGGGYDGDVPVRPTLQLHNCGGHLRFILSHVYIIYYIVARSRLDGRRVLSLLYCCR